MNTTHNHCSECGSTEQVAFSNETHSVRARSGKTADVAGLSGWRCACGEIAFDDASMVKYAAAGDELVLQERKAIAESLRSTRQKLHLTQQQAAVLTGGGHNAFSRYESAQAAPMPAVVNLFRLLDKHPELLQEIAE